MRQPVLRVFRGVVLAAAVGAAGYAAFVGRTWLRYGRTPARSDATRESLLDRFMLDAEVVERHQLIIDAPPDETFLALTSMDLERSPIVRAIFKAREWVLGASGPDTRQPRGIVAQTTALGWTVLAEVPNREIVLGAVTKPWEANVVFRGLPPEEFVRFREPDHVKIVWNLRAVPLDGRRTLATTETRVNTTDRDARRKFRWYWARFSAGVELIRVIGLRLVRDDAERRAQRGSGSSRETVVPPAGGTSM